MSVESKFSNNNNNLLITIEGDFHFSYLQMFNKSYQTKEALLANKVVVDMRDVKTVDSSALGMLLSMKKYLNKNDNEIVIINCNKAVKNIFTITNFSKLFTIE